MTFIQDNRSSSTMTADSRVAVATMTQDVRNYKFLWVSTIFPWQELLPWQIPGIGLPITQDIRS